MTRLCIGKIAAIQYKIHQNERNSLMIALRLLATFLAVLFFASLRPSLQAGEVLSEWRKPTITEMINLFNIATRPIPEKMMFEAVIKKQQWVIPPKPEPANSVENSELESLEWNPPQFYTRQVREWFSRRLLYRIDYTDLNSLESLVELYHEMEENPEELTKKFLAEYKTFVYGLKNAWGTENLVLDYTDVTIMDPKFLKGTEHPDVKNFSISHNKQFSGGSTVEASITPRNVPSFSANLWKAHILNIELAFPIVLHFAKKSETVAQDIDRNSPFQSLAGFLPDIAKIEESIRGGGHFKIQTREEKIGSKFVTHIALQRLPSAVEKFRDALKLLPSDAQSVMPMLTTIFGAGDFSYWMDKHNPSQLIRAEKIMDGKIVTAHVWDSFNKQGFPMYWSTEVPGPFTPSETVTNVVNFILADLNPKFQDEDIFGLNLWDGIKKVYKIDSRTGEVLYNPLRVKIRTTPIPDLPPRQPLNRHWVNRFVLVAFYVGAAFLVWRALQQRKENERNKNPYRIR